MKFREDAEMNWFAWVEHFVEAVNEAAKVEVQGFVRGQTPRLNSKAIATAVMSNAQVEGGETFDGDLGDLKEQIEKAAQFLLRFTNRIALTSSIEFRAYLFSRTEHWKHLVQNKENGYTFFPHGGVDEDAKSVARKFLDKQPPSTSRAPLADNDEDAGSGESSLDEATSDEQRQRRLDEQAAFVASCVPKCPLYLPKARYDEVYLEMLTGLWCASFLCGYRAGRLWAQVRWLVAHRTSAYPSGVCENKLAADVIRSSRRRLLEFGPLASIQAHSEGLIDLRLRIWTKEPLALDWGQYCLPKKDIEEARAEMDKDPNSRWHALITDEGIRRRHDLTPGSFRNLGGLYVIVMLASYIRDNLPITYLFPKEVVDALEGDTLGRLEDAKALFANVKDNFPLPTDAGNKEGRRVAVFGVLPSAIVANLPTVILGHSRGMIFSKPKGQAGYSGLQADQDFLWGNHNALKQASMEAGNALRDPETDSKPCDLLSQLFGVKAPSTPKDS